MSTLQVVGRLALSYRVEHSLMKRSWLQCMPRRLDSERLITSLCFAMSEASDITATDVRINLRKWHLNSRSLVYHALRSFRAVDFFDSSDFVRSWLSDLDQNPRLLIYIGRHGHEEEESVENVHLKQSVLFNTQAYADRLFALRQNEIQKYRMLRTVEAPLVVQEKPGRFSPFDYDMQTLKLAEKKHPIERVPNFFCAASLLRRSDERESGSYYLLVHRFRFSPSDLIDFDVIEFAYKHWRQAMAEAELGSFEQLDELWLEAKEDDARNAWLAILVRKGMQQSKLRLPQLLFGYHPEASYTEFLFSEMPFKAWISANFHQGILTVATARRYV